MYSFFNYYSQICNIKRSLLSIQLSQRDLALIVRKCDRSYLNYVNIEAWIVCVYRLQGVEFEWDTNKFQINLEKDGISFEEAAEVFFDPFYQEGDATANDEQRNFILGYSRTQRLLLVVYVERSLRIRIISSRPATRTERKLYEQF
ncbi:BrnT family toxin [Microcoleus sp. herbarium12]|uniref:BrnT family toxin n=1 Tax=Microcoleus sp. herbarium12 TaxID=3055437 RepID=UPI002FD4F321